MKKLMIAAAIVLAAVASEAATIKWSSGAILNPTADGKGFIPAPGGRILSSSAVEWYVFTDLTDAQLTAAKTAGTAYGWLSSTPEGATKLSPTAQGTGSSGTLTGIQTDKYSGGDTVNWASVIVYTDGDGKVWYNENYAASTFDDLGSQITVNNVFGKNATSGSSITAWSTQSVPEPTSGLLLVLGIAGLALRRRRA